MPEELVKKSGVNTPESGQPESGVNTNGQGSETQEVAAPEAVDTTSEQKETLAESGEQIVDSALRLGQSVTRNTVGRIFRALGGYSALGAAIAVPKFGLKALETGVIGVGDFVFGTKEHPGILEVPGIVARGMGGLGLTLAREGVKRVQNFDRAVRVASSGFMETLANAPERTQSNPDAQAKIDRALVQQKELERLRRLQAQEQERKAARRIDELFLERLQISYDDEEILDHDLGVLSAQTQELDGDSFIRLQKMDLKEGEVVRQVELRPKGSNKVTRFDIVKMVDPRSGKYLYKKRNVSSSSAV